MRSSLYVPGCHTMHHHHSINIAADMVGKWKIKRMFSEQNVRHLTALPLHKQCSICDPNKFPRIGIAVTPNWIVEFSQNGCRFCLFIKNVFYVYCAREVIRAAEMEHYGNYCVPMGAQNGQTTSAAQRLNLGSGEAGSLIINIEYVAANSSAIEIFILPANPSPWLCNQRAGQVSGENSTIVSQKKKRH